MAKRTCQRLTRSNRGREAVSAPHATVATEVWIDVDVGIVDAVRKLNRMDGVRTHTSCQGGDSYRPYVQVTWETPSARRLIEREFDLTQEGPYWGYAHPRPAHQERGIAMKQRFDGRDGNGYQPTKRSDGSPIDGPYAPPPNKP